MCKAQMSLSQAFGDAQTTITCLAAGIGGATSDAISTAIVSRVAPQATAGIGSLGLEFCLRSVVSAGTFGCLHSYMPETGNNIFFSILYFACDRGLMNSAVGLSKAAVNAVQRTAMSPMQRAPSQPVPPANPTAILTGCNTKSCAQ